MAPRNAPKTDEPAELVDEAPKRVFALRKDAQIGEGDQAEPVHRVSFGCAPRVSLGAGDRFETSDPFLADALAADPHLEELSK